MPFQEQTLDTVCGFGPKAFSTVLLLLGLHLQVSSARGVGVPLWCCVGVVGVRTYGGFLVWGALGLSLTGGQRFTSLVLNVGMPTWHPHPQKPLLAFALWFCVFVFGLVLVGCWHSNFACIRHK